MTALPALTELQASQYSSNVQIFEHTLAIDIPDRLDAIAESFKEFNVDNNVSIVNTINQNMNTLFSYVGTTIVSDVEDFKDGISNDISTLTSDLQSNIANYIDSDGVGYSIGQVNSLIFSGNSSYVENVDGDIIEMTSGAVKTFDVVYDEDKNMSSFKEKITIDSIEYVKSFSIDNTGSIPIVSEIPPQ